MFESSMAAALAEQGQFDRALAHADKAIKLSNDDGKVRERCNKAQILGHASRYAEAIAECEQTLKEFTGALQVQSVRYTLSSVYSLQGDHAKSEEQLRLILEVDPDAPLASNNLGYQMADRNIHLDEAERLIRRGSKSIAHYVRVPKTTARMPLISTALVGCCSARVNCLKHASGWKKLRPCPTERTTPPCGTISAMCWPNLTKRSRRKKPGRRP